MSAVPVVAPPQAELIPLASIDPSPSNPRRRSSPEDDERLVESIRKQGVLQPVVVRPKKRGRFELVFGSRRLAAAGKVGLEALPALVREMNDVEVLEAQLAENAARADVFPLDEAEAYRRLHEDHGVAIEEIVAKVGKSRAWVYGRLKLLSLAPGVRKMLEEGEIDPSRALLVARLPSHKLQLEAAKEVLGVGHPWRREPMSYRDTRDFIERTYLLRLGNVAWALEDAELVAEAGACAVCPKRSGNQTDLFDSDEATDLCLDRACFEGKLRAHGQRLLEAARAGGAKVLPRSKAKEVFSPMGGLRSDSGFVELDRPWPHDTKKRSLRKLLKGSEIERMVAAGPDGTVVEIVPMKAAREALKEAGVAVERAPASWEVAEKKRRAQRKVEAEIDLRVERAEAAALFAAVVEGDLSAECLRNVARVAVKNLFDEDLGHTVAALGIEVVRTRKTPRWDDPEARSALVAWIDSAARAQLFGVIALAVSGASMPDALKAFGVDHRALERKVRAEAKKAVTPARKKAPSKRAAKKQPRRSA